MKMEEEITRAKPKLQILLALPTQHLSLQTKPELESRPEITGHFKKQNEGKKVCAENAQKKTHLSGNEKGLLENAENEFKNDKNGTFWTVCPYCYCMYEYEKLFEECCLLCQNQNCTRAFHGVAVVKPKKKMLVEGKDEYYCGLGYFGLKYSLNGSENKKESVGEGKSYNVGTVVEISDDSDGGGGGGKGVNLKSGEGDKEDVLKGNVKGVMLGSGKTEVKNEGKKLMARKKVKSVPRNSKKGMGRGVKSRKIDGGNASGSGTGGDGCDTDLEFIEKDGDVFVGVKSYF